MEGGSTEMQALQVIEKMGADAGEALDEPVVEYLARLLMDAVSDASELDDLHEALSNFLPGLKDVENAVAGLVQAVSGEEKTVIVERSEKEHSDHSPQFVGSGDSDDTFTPSASDISTTEPTKTQTEDIASAVANVKLNACAKEFVPLGPAQDLTDNSCASSFHGWNSISEDEASDISQVDTGYIFQEFLETGAEDSVDAIGLFSCLYPMYSIDALQTLLSGNDGNVALTLRILSQIESDVHTSTASHATAVQEKIVDMGESAFPSLPGTGSAANSMHNVQKSPSKCFLTAVKKQPVKTVNQHQMYYNPQETTTFLRQAPKKSIPWVDTGETVSKQYSEAREEAREFARRRNAYFEQATKAYLAGNKALAKDLGAKGRWCCDKMKECHATAAEGIFQDRNKRFRNNKSGVPQVIDLHGLHMSEASRILHRELEWLSKLGKLQAISLLVGTGHHTKGSRTPSRLPGAVRRFLDKEGYIHKPGQPGVIEVKL